MDISIKINSQIAEKMSLKTQRKKKEKLQCVLHIVNKMFPCSFRPLFQPHNMTYSQKKASTSTKSADTEAVSLPGRFCPMFIQQTSLSAHWIFDSAAEYICVRDSRMHLAFGKCDKVTVGQRNLARRRTTREILFKHSFQWVQDQSRARRPEFQCHSKHGT